MLRRYNYVLQIVLDILSSVAALALSILLRSDLKLASAHWDSFWFYAIVFTVIVVTGGLIFNNYRNMRDYVGAVDFTNTLMVSSLTAVVLLMLRYVGFIDIGASIIINFTIINFLFMLSIRFSKKAWQIITRLTKHSLTRNPKRVLVYGKKEELITIIRTLNEENASSCKIMAAITDTPDIWGTNILGIKVVGGRNTLQKTISRYKIEEIVSSVDSAETDYVRELHTYCKQNGISLKMFQNVIHLDSYKKMQKPKAIIRDLSIEDLLGRTEIALETDWINRFIKDKVVLVTGGAGSIGSEICRQSLQFDCKLLIAFDIHENGLFDLENELSQLYESEKISTVIGSIRDKHRLETVFEKFKPDVVFHAAAHKHVPLMEINPCEAIKNNIFGTMNVIDQCSASGVKKMIVISSDKAVNPANVMGATKRITEMLVQAFGVSSRTEMAAVRFGNVLGSNGSVIPLFKKQIAAGGPITLTHPNIQRYFMTISEAVQLVLQAGALASRGEIFVFDMGKLIKIYDLACEMIKLSGLEPEKDIEIKITGLRPGEKLFEELRLDREKVDNTKHDKIYVSHPMDIDKEYIVRQLNLLRMAIDNDDEAYAVDCLFSLVPSEYRQPMMEQKV